MAGRLAEHPLLGPIQLAEKVSNLRGSESSGGLAAKHLALGAKGHKFDPIVSSKIFSE
jgi:hypothetical protein